MYSHFCTLNKNNMRSSNGILWGVLQSPLSVVKMYKEGNPHHITLMYNVEQSRCEKYIGKAFTAKVISHLYNENIQAVVVDLPDGIPFELTVPHVTVSYREGISPVESTKMILGDHQTLHYDRKTVEFKIEFYSFK